METTLIHTFKKLGVANCLLTLYLCYIQRRYPKVRAVTLSSPYINVLEYLPLSLIPT